MSSYQRLPLPESLTHFSGTVTMTCTCSSSFLVRFMSCQRDWEPRKTSATMKLYKSFWESDHLEVFRVFWWFTPHTHSIHVPHVVITFLNPHNPRRLTPHPGKFGHVHTKGSKTSLSNSSPEAFHNMGHTETYVCNTYIYITCRTWYT